MRSHRLNGQSGFTFLELIIAGAMIAVLAAIAVPFYQHHVLRSNRILAKAVLADLASRQEAYSLQNGAYAENLNALLGNRNPGSGSFFLARNGERSESRNASSLYEVELLNPGPASFDLSVRAVGVQAGDKDCQRFMLNHKGQRKATASRGSDPTSCWQ